MSKSRLWALVGLPVLLAGCGGDDAAVEEAPMGGMETETPATDPAATPSGDMGGMASTVTMQPLRDSGVTGEATVTPQGGQLQVMVRLTGLSGQGEHPGHIHSGTCDNVGGVVAPLQPITASGDGTGTMTTTASVDPNTVMNGQHVIQYHQAGGGPGVVCGNIQAHQM